MLRKLSCPSELAVRDRATSPINYTCSTDAGFQWCSFQTIFQPEAAAKYKVSPLSTWLPEMHAHSTCDYYLWNESIVILRSLLA